MGVAEASLGAAIMLLVALDLLLTILYAKIGSRGLSRFGAGVGSMVVARTVWALLRGLARRLGRRFEGLMSLAGPLSLLLVLVLWVLTLVLGAALIIHPALGHAVRATSGPTPTDFGSALYAAASSLSLSSTSDLAPESGGLRVLYLVDSLIGTFLVALVISYVMPVYNALRDRNALALSLDLLSRETGEAAEVVAGLGPRGDFGVGQGVLADLAMRMTSVKEAHHFYPLLFFFHASVPAHSLVRCIRLSLDTVSLLRTGVDDEGQAFKASGPLWQLQRATMLLVDTLSCRLHPGSHPARSARRRAAGALARALPAQLSPPRRGRHRGLPRRRGGWRRLRLGARGVGRQGAPDERLPRPRRRRSRSPFGAARGRHRS